MIMAESSFWAHETVFTVFCVKNKVFIDHNGMAYNAVSV